MASWTVERLLERVQELIGEPAGGFYNLSDRLITLNTAQEELVLETEALSAHTTLSVTNGEAILPDDFLAIGNATPYAESGAGNRYPLDMVPQYFVEREFPIHNSLQPFTGIPTHAVMEDGKLILYPALETGSVTLRYIRRPAELFDLPDIPFDGDTRLNRYAEGIAFYAANRVMLPRNPQLATVYQNAYIQFQKNMRHDLRKADHAPQRIRLQKLRSYR